MEGAFPAGPSRALGFGGPVVAATLGLACLTAGCSNYIGTTAASFLRKVREEPDPNVRYLAYAKLGQPNTYDNETQKAEAVQTMIAKLDPAKEPVATRAVILHALGELRDPAAHDAVVKAVNDPEPILRVQACRALGKVGRREDATILTRVMTVDTLEDCRIAAIESLGELKPDDPRITRMLIAGMQNDDPATRLASLRALRRITGRDLGTDPEVWAKVIPPDTGPALASTTRKPGTPAYPPRPTPPPTTDPEIRTAVLPTSPATGAGNYPSHNPNLPPGQTGR